MRTRGNGSAGSITVTPSTRRATVLADEPDTRPAGGQEQRRDDVEDLEGDPPFDRVCLEGVLHDLPVAPVEREVDVVVGGEVARCDPFQVRERMVGGAHGHEPHYSHRVHLYAGWKVRWLGSEQQIEGP